MEREVESFLFGVARKAYVLCANNLLRLLVPEEER